MPLELYLAYVLACTILVIVPGPNVSLIIANSLAHGTRAGLLNVAGSQLGLAVMVGIVIVGLASLIEALGHWFDVLRLIGAAYLVWIGVKMFRAPVGKIDTAANLPKPRGGFFLQGFLVLMSNPKVLLLFGAFLPQFMDPKGDYLSQVLLLGVTFMVIAAVSDSLYALLVGRAGLFLSQGRMRLLSRVSGACLIGGGIWMALARAR